MKASRVLILSIAALLIVAGAAAADGSQEAPLGTEENPIIWSFVPSGEMERVAAGAQSVADMLEDETGYFFATNVATEYAGVIEALASDPPEAHMASLATFAYILASERGGADVSLVASRFGSLTYSGQLIAKKGSGITGVGDLKGKTFARPDPLSTSGWIVPMVTMKAAGIDPDRDLKEIVDAGSHDAVVAAVYSGDVDVGSVYVDARTRIEEDYPDVMETVIVLAVSEPIPNDGVQFHPSVPADMRELIVAALLKIAGTEEGKAALDTAYQWAGLERRNDTFYDPFRQVLQAAGMSAEELQ